MQQKSDRQPAPPLATWALTGVLAGAGLAAIELVGSDPITPPPEVFLDFNKPRVEAFSSVAGDDHYRVLMLGNSRLKYATGGEADLQELEQVTRGSEILRLVNDWATFSDFEPFIDELLERAPDLVLIQLELMSQERSTSANVRYLRLYLKWLLFGGSGERWNPGDLDQGALQYDVPCAGTEATPAAVAKRLARTGKWLTHNPDGQSGAAARRFVDNLRQRGARVVFLSIPRSSAMDEARPESRFTERSLSEDERAGIWHYPQTVSDRDFCDTIHLSETGRSAYKGWLAEKILAARRLADDKASPSISSR